MEMFICSIFDKPTAWYKNNRRRKRRGDFSNNSFTGFTITICALREQEDAYVYSFWTCITHAAVFEGQTRTYGSVQGSLPC